MRGLFIFGFHSSRMDGVEKKFLSPDGACVMPQTQSAIRLDQAEGLFHPCSLSRRNGMGKFRGTVDES
jgi:hypothetical protein